MHKTQTTGFSFTVRRWIPKWSFVDHEEPSNDTVDEKT